MKPNVFFIYILLLVTTCGFSFAQIKWSDFNNSVYYTPDDGLASAQGYSIVEDKHGFLWYGSRAGLSKFDGSQFKNYYNYFENDSLREIKLVSSLAIDKTKTHLWLSAGNSILYTSTDSITFRSIKNLYPSFNYPVSTAKSLYLDEENTLWIGSYQNGLIKADHQDRNHKQFKLSDPRNPNTLALNTIYSIVKDTEDEHILWLGSVAGLVKFNTKTEEYQIYYFDDDPKRLQTAINKIQVTKDYIYLGTLNQGLVTFNKKTNEFRQPLKKQFPPSKTYFITLDLYKDQGSNLWYSSPSGLMQFDMINQELVKEIPNDLPNEKYRGISLVDSRGIIWFASGRGLFKYTPLQPANTFIQLENRNSLEPPLELVRIIPYKGFYYVTGLLSSGIYKVNPLDNSFEVIDIPYLNRYEVGYAIKDMVQMDDGKFLILSLKKMVIFDPETGSFEISPLQIPDKPRNSLATIEKDQNNTFWVGTYRDGLFHFDFDNLKIKNFKDLFDTNKNTGYNKIKRLYLDSKRRLWIGQGSTSVFNLTDSSFVCFDPEFWLGPARDYGNIQEDIEGRIWLASFEKGLNYIDPSQMGKGISKYLDGHFYRIHKYNDSLFWTIGARKEAIYSNFLGILNIKTLAHREIKVNLGEKLRDPILSVGKGDFMIGTDNGIRIFNPTEIERNQEYPIPYIRSIEGNGERLYDGETYSNKAFNFPNGTKNLIVNISALGFQLANQITFKYALNNEEWIDLGTNREINLTNLKHGYYSLKIKAFNSLDNSLIIPTTYNFSIPPYWYQSWWAYALYFISFATFSIILYRNNLKRHLAVAETKKTKELDDLKSTMFANISHEFRTPLTVINGLSEVILKEAPGKDEKIGAIHHNGKQLLNMVNQMLDLASLDADKMAVRYKSGDVVEFIENCVSLFKSYADSKQQELLFKSEIPNLVMDLDDDKLQKIINNMLSNAIKFTPEKGTILVEVQRKDKKLKIRIKDSGKGIHPKHLPHVFERYYKTFDEDHNVGSGIGMALTKELVELLNGSISVESLLGKETIFKVELPITNTISKNDILNYHNPFIDQKSINILSERQSIRIEDASILIVEDNADISNYLSYLLSDQYLIHIAKNGKKGLKIARNKKIDFIISDIMMPEMDGFKFCKLIKSDIKTSHIPFIMLSARSESKDKLKAYKLGIDAYLTKPFNVEELKLIIKNLIEKKEKQTRYFSNLLHFKNKHTKVSSINSLDVDLIKNLQELILDNTNKLSIQQLAKKLYSSRSQLHRKITALTGMSITHYINYIRIKKAEYLLKTTDLTISEIAFDIGFNDPSYFSKTFKKSTKFSPIEYRKKNSNRIYLS